MLLGVLARAAAAIGKIIKDPIGFLGNFVNAVKSGIVNFGAHILDHLKNGLQKWLLGALSEGGIELPQTWDLKGVVQLVLSIIGMTWERIKARIFAKVPGLQPVWDKVIGAFEVLKILVDEGIGGLWNWVLQKAGDIKEMIMGQIKEMVATQIIKAGITWLISMLNPAGAFIKACKMIYDVVMFFVEKASQIKEFVDSVLDSVESIAAGGVGAVADKIEQTLAKLVPLLIGFLANLLGLGGIADKVKKIIETVQKPVMQVVDWVVGKAVGLGKRFVGFAKKVGGKVTAAKTWVRGKAKRGKAWLGQRAMAAGRALGLIKRRFAANGESHTLSIDQKSGSIRMASTEGPVLDRVRDAVRRANRRRSDMGKPPVDVDAHVARITSQVDALSVVINGGKAGASDAARRMLDALAVTVQKLLTFIGGGSGERSAQTPAGLGRVAPHSQNSSHGTSKSPEAEQLESEHVIPVRFVSMLFEVLGDARLIVRGSSEDSRQHTILIYKGAAKLKTWGKAAADKALIGQFKSLLLRGVPLISGRSQAARKYLKLP